ncbi:hypothetical protein Cfor_05763 [Coptotermes formosanus]|uniref:Uncharacterized protein n=1 Tax=Coptotermes formosanus TaxID=36987 RepID=A0A6L2PY01_COPFO|nr:hypothetical protein Cfor_05763 [Coptotermes formosanus]
MDTSRCVPSVAHGILMDVTFWLLFITRTATSLPVQTLDEILQSVGSEDSLLTADLGNIYAFTHKAWSPHVPENEVPANMEHVNRSPRLYVVLDDQDDTEQVNVTATPGSAVRAAKLWEAEVGTVTCTAFLRRSYGGSCVSFMWDGTWEFCSPLCASAGRLLLLAACKYRMEG